MADDPDFLTLAEIAKKLGVHRRTTQRLMEAGEIPGRKIGGRWMAPAWEWQSYVHGRWTQGAAHV